MLEIWGIMALLTPGYAYGYKKIMKT